VNQTVTITRSLTFYQKKKDWGDVPGGVMRARVVRLVVMGGRCVVGVLVVGALVVGTLVERVMVLQVEGILKYS
jgi:hypothetical protein